MDFIKYNFESKRNDYLTPPELVSKILNKIGQDKFFADVCCSKTNIPAMLHAINGRVDGLKVSWNWKDYGLEESHYKPENLWIYCNPPYDTCGAWVKKAYEEQQRGTNSILLIPARTEAKFWHDYILDNDRFSFKRNVTVQFLRKGTCFLNPDTGEKIKMKSGDKIVDGVYKNALAIVYFRGRK